jgi:hypothetical protein
VHKFARHLVMELSPDFFLNRNYFSGTILIISFNFWSSSNEQSHNYKKECAKLNFVGECLGQDAYTICLHILLGKRRSQFIQSETKKRRQICRGGRGAKWQILLLGTYTYFWKSFVSESVEVQSSARYFSVVVLTPASDCPVLLNP